MVSRSVGAMVMAWSLLAQGQPSAAETDLPAAPWSVLVITVDCLRPDHTE